MAAVMKDESVGTQLCLSCGLCCNGVLFKDVRLQPGDDRPRLESLGIPVRGRVPTPSAATGKPGKPQSPGGRFPQPCAALQTDRRCAIYPQRPVRCARFECLLFKDVMAGRMTLAAGLKIIREAQRRAERVRRLLRQLGETNETAALSTRFRAVRRKMEGHPPRTEAEAECYADLTLAVHDLNLLLNGAFYC